METKNTSKKIVNQFRGVIQTKHYQCLSTFNYEAYQMEHTQPFGKLCVVNDEYLSAKSYQEFVFNNDLQVLLIPLIGAVDFNINNTPDDFVHINQVQLLSVKKNDTLKISNPYENNFVNFLQLHIKSNQLTTQTLAFNVELKNKLQTIFTSADFNISIGIFDSKQEDVYQLQNNNNGIFAYVMNGAFEYEGRLLENRDGICIWNENLAEFESLSFNGILLVLEVNL